MTIKEYKLQKALGTIDYLVAARTTKSTRVLNNIYNTIFTSSLPIEDETWNTTILLAITLNNSISQELLIKILSNPVVPELVLEEAAHNNKISLVILQDAMKVNEVLNFSAKVRRHVHNLQLVARVPEADLIQVYISRTTCASTDYPYYTWASINTLDNNAHPKWYSIGSE
jgi:hypothetical protein